MTTMKRAGYTVLFSALMIVMVSGCSNKSNAAERKSVLSQKISALQDYGLDLNRTVDTPESTHYTVTVKDAGKATMALMHLAHQAVVLPETKAKIEKILLNLKQAEIEIDWKKYAANQAQSVFVWLRGNGHEAPGLHKFLQEKKLGIYLSYDAKDLLKQIDLKDIDDTFGKKADRTHVMLHGAHLTIAKAATETSPSSKMDFQGGTLKITSEGNQSKTGTFTTQNLHCQIDQSNAYLGTWDCRLPLVSFSMTGAVRNPGTLTIEQSKLHYVASEENKKIKSDGIFQIGSFTFQSAPSAKQKVTWELKGLKLGMITGNLDASLIKSLYAQASKPQTDLNASINTSMKLLAKMFANGTTIDYDFSLDSLNATSNKHNKTGKFLLEAFSEKGNVTFGDRIQSHDTTTVKSISGTDGTGRYAVKNIHYNSSVDDLYNFLPDFMNFAAKSAQHKPSASLSKAEKDLLNAMLTKLVQSGAKLRYGPISVDKTDFNFPPTQASYGKMQVDLNATLAKNTIDMKSPMGPMMLLSYLHADGKIVLDKTDLEKMAKDFSPKMMAMAMMLAKFEGDKAVFDLTFEKGHLKVNGKPIM